MPWTYSRGGRWHFQFLTVSWMWWLAPFQGVDLLDLMGGHLMAVYGQMQLSY